MTDPIDQNRKEELLRFLGGLVTREETLIPLHDAVKMTPPELLKEFLSQPEVLALMRTAKATAVAANKPGSTMYFEQLIAEHGAERGRAHGKT